MKYTHYIGVPLLGVIVCALLFTAPPAQAGQVDNRVLVESVSSGGNQSATVNVKTIVNGQVVEDYEKTSSSGTVSYSSHVDIADIQASSSVSASAYQNLSNGAKREALIVLLRELIRLLTRAATAT